MDESLSVTLGVTLSDTKCVTLLVEDCETVDVPWHV